jgi:hypothetical protein
MRLLTFFILSLGFSAPAFAQDVPRRMRATDTEPVTLVRSSSYPEFLATWGHDVNGHRVLCLTYTDGTRSCHAPGVSRRGTTLGLSLAGGLVLAASLNLFAAGAVVHRGCFDCGGSAAFFIPASLTLAGGTALLGVGLARGSQRRRAFRWILERRAAVVPIASRSERGLSFTMSF